MALIRIGTAGASVFGRASHACGRLMEDLQFWEEENRAMDDYGEKNDTDKKVEGLDN